MSNLSAFWALVCATSVGPAVMPAASLQVEALQKEFRQLAVGFDGRVGICAQDESGQAGVNSDKRFSLQSVMKLVVSLAVMDAVDHRGWRLEQPVLVRKQDLSLYVQPIAKLVTEQGYRTTVGDLVRRAIVDSDTAAVDILVDKLGGPAQVQAFLERRGVTGVRVDRDEKHLQTEIVGLTWRPEFVDEAVLRRAIAGVPESRREQAYRSYQQDPRDSATPSGHGIAAVLAGAGEAAVGGIDEVCAGGHATDRDVSGPAEGRGFGGLDTCAQDRHERGVERGDGGH